jgi:MFS family permease
MKLKTFPIFLAFLAMGFGDAVGPFVGLAKESFSLSNTMAQLIPFVGFIMFGLLSVPMGIYQDKKGKKFVLMLGLGLALAGLLIPTIFGLTTYEYFLLTVLLLGAGATTLQVAGNPIMRDVSEEGKFARNLTIGQFVKAIGSLSGPVLPAAAAYFWSGDWHRVSGVLFGVDHHAPLRGLPQGGGEESGATICISRLMRGVAGQQICPHDGAWHIPVRRRRSVYEFRDPSLPPGGISG